MDKLYIYIFIFFVLVQRHMLCDFFPKLYINVICFVFGAFFVY